MSKNKKILIIVIFSLIFLAVCANCFFQYCLQRNASSLDMGYRIGTADGPGNKFFIDPVGDPDLLKELKARKDLEENSSLSGLITKDSFLFLFMKDDEIKRRDGIWEKLDGIIEAEVFGYSVGKDYIEYVVEEERWTIREKRLLKDHNME